MAMDHTLGPSYLVVAEFCSLFYFPPSFEQLHRSSSKRQAILNFDYGGAIIFSGSLISFVLGMSWAGGKFGTAHHPLLKTCFSLTSEPSLEICRSHCPHCLGVCWTNLLRSMGYVLF